MGDAADDLTDYLENKHLYPFGIDVMMALPNRDAWRDKIHNSDWTMRNGEKVKFKDMDLSHLKNVRNLVVSNKREHHEKLDDYYKWRVTLERKIDM